MQKMTVARDRMRVPTTGGDYGNAKPDLTIKPKAAFLFPKGKEPSSSYS